MTEHDKRIRRDALKLIAIGIALGLVLGFAIGLEVANRSIERVVVVPLESGVEI